MKKKYSLFKFSSICLLLVCLCSIAREAKAQSQNGLVQHYPFTGTLTNTAATHTMTGGSNFTGDRFGLSASAYYVQTNTDIISNAGITGLPIGGAARTVSFWFQTPTSSGVYHLFNYGAAGHGFYIFYNNGVISVGDGVTNVFVASIGASTAWRHVAVTYENNLFILYVNGVKTKQEYLTLNTAANPASRIGKDAGTTLTSNFKIDDLYIYNRALPIEDVATLYSVKCLADPVATLVTDTICTGQTVRINFNRIVYLYATSQGGTSIALNDSYTTPALTTTTTYYMQAGSGSCVSNMVPVTVPVKAKAATPTSATMHYEATLCEYGNAILRVEPNASYTAKWYSSSTGGTAVATGVNYTTPLLASNKTYYVAHEGATVCASDRIPVDVTVLTRPVATLTANQTTVCPGDTVSFSGFENVDFSLHKNNIWVAGGYFYDGPHSYKDAPQQTSTYILSVGDWAMCRGTATVTVTVKPAPAVVITTSKSSICSGENVTLTASGANGYVWSTGGTAAGTIQSPSVTTTYSVKGTSISNNCSKTVSTTITVTPLPTILITPASATICRGESTTLTASSSGATTYSWSTSATTAGITTSPVNTTTYEVTGTSNGCSKTAYATVTVKDLPLVAITPTAASVCAGESASLTASGATTYAWSTGSTQAVLDASPTATTTYTVTGTSNGCSKTATATVTVNALPIPTIQQNGNTLQTQVYNLYQWYKDGSPIQNATSRNYEMETTGDFTVFVTSLSGCSAMSDPINITATSIVDYMKSGSINAYPNPTSSLLTIDLPQDTQVRIFSMTGEQVGSFGARSGQTSVTVDHLSPGVYLLMTDRGESIKFSVK